MDINLVGKLPSSAFEARNFFDIEFRKKTEEILKDFCAEFNLIGVHWEWRNLGAEDDLDAFGVALVVQHYEIRYKLVSEDFEVWYRDTVNPKVWSDLETSDCLEDAMCELFKNLAEDDAKKRAFLYFDSIDAAGKFPAYDDDPVRKRQDPDAAVLAKILQRSPI